MTAAPLPTADFAPGGYRYIPAQFQFSSGVAALDGFRLERAMFRVPVPLAEGFRRIAAHLAALGRPLTAFAACELRSPGQMSEAGFRAFNLHYVTTLRDWGIATETANPVARSNVCPEIGPPAEPSVHAFTYTMPDDGARGSFVIAGTADVADGPGGYRERIVRYGDTSPDGLAEKARFVLDRIEDRMAALGFGFADATALQVYAIHDFHHLVADVVRRGAAAHGIAWHYCQAPVVGLDFEIDCRGVAVERVI